jgi:hypothetical protein
MSLYTDNFHNFLKLDSNVIGVIFSMISDDFFFLLFLRENNIKPYFNKIKWNNIDFKNASNLIDIVDNDFINKFQDKLDWDIISKKMINDQEFIEIHDQNINFDIISKKMKFDDSYDYNFFCTYKKELDWGTISQWDYIAEDFIDLFNNELDWTILSKQQGLTEYLLYKYEKKIVVESLKMNININNECKEKIILKITNNNLYNEIYNNPDQNSTVYNTELLEEEINMILPLSPENNVIIEPIIFNSEDEEHIFINIEEDILIENIIELSSDEDIDIERGIMELSDNESEDDDILDISEGDEDIDIERIISSIIDPEIERRRYNNS